MIALMCTTPGAEGTSKGTGGRGGTSGMGLDKGSGVVRGSKDYGAVI